MYKCLRACPRKGENKEQGEKPLKQHFNGFSDFLKNFLIKKTDFIHQAFCINKPDLRHESGSWFIFNHSNWNTKTVFFK